MSGGLVDHSQCAILEAYPGLTYKLDKEKLKE